MTALTPQRTIRTATRCTGVALHSGETVSMTLLPAPAGSGIVFRRIDLGGVEIAATWRNVIETPMCTALGDGAGNRVATVEHLMAACAGCGIDNLLVEIDGPELPIMDGSAGPLVFLIDCAGTVAQEAPRRVIRVLREIRVSDAERSASLAPAEDFTVTVEIAYPHPSVPKQRLTVRLDRFRAEVARARTYGFLDDVEALHAAGLARGASLQNAVVIGADGVVNEEGLRYPDEFVRHKALDAIGDLCLAGAPIRGRFEGIRSGHRMNHRLLAALFAAPDAWRWESLADTAAAAPRSAVG